MAGEKLDAICNMRRRLLDWDTILEEIAKCDVVCSNCHRARTYFRRSGIERCRPKLVEMLGPNFVVVPVYG